MATALNLDGLTAAQLFQLRANTKRAHTKIVGRINGLINRRGTIADCVQQLDLLKATFGRLQAINNRYIASALLDDNDKHAASVYLQQIYLADQETRQLVSNYLGPQAPRRQGSWIVHDSIVSQPLRRSWSVSSTDLNRPAPTLPHDSSTGENHYNTTDNGSPLPFDQYPDAESEASKAKRRKLLLEMELESNRQQNQKEVDALLQARQQLDDNLLAQIRNEERLIALTAPVPAIGPPTLTSTFITPDAITPTPLQPVTVAPPTMVSLSSSRWNKITVQKFNGDPRSWKRFDQGVTATIKDTTMPDSLKLLSLEDLLVDEIRKRVAHLFTGTGSSFNHAYTELKTKYGSPGLVMQAHNTHLLQTLPMKVGDFNALFTLAADVRDAVSSVPEDHLLAFTYSTVISSLASKLPTQLQIDWGKFAYALQPALPTLKDFDRWIDIAVGAEENRGNRFLAPAPRTTSVVPRTHQTTYGQAGSSNYRQQLSNSFQSTGGSSHIPTVLTQSVSQDATKPPFTFPQCSVCNENPGHRLDFCNTFKRMLVNQRAAVVADSNHCFKCLIKGHYGRDCRRTPPIKCHTCSEGHHTLLHGADRQFPNKKGIMSTDILFLRTSLSISLQPVLLAIVPVTLINGSIVCNTFAILDNGSEATLVTKSLATRLNLTGDPIRIRISTLGGSVLLDSEAVSFKLTSLVSVHDARGVFVVPTIDISHRRIEWPSIKGNWPHLASLDIPALDSSLVEILIGMDQVYAHTTFGLSEPDSDSFGPTAIKTAFGWTVVGRIPPALVSGPSTKKRISLQLLSREPDLSTLVQRFHLSESISPTTRTSSSISFDDEQALTVLSSSIKFIGCGWQVDLPLRSPYLSAPNNRDQAVSRFFGMERKLSRPENFAYAEKYNTIMLKLIDSGVAELVPKSDINSPDGMVWYLPHHFVLYPNKPGKIRVVMDWAVNYRGFVLNEHLFRGPSLLPSLVGILLRTRQFRVAVSADIEAFYHRIGIPRHQRSLQRLVFREFGTNSPLLTYQLTTLVFGAINASTSAIWVLRHAMNQNKSFPDVAATVEDDYYSDNLSRSFETEEEAITFSANSIKSMANAGFNLTGFASSSIRVLASLPEKDRAPPVRDLNFDALPTEYILGMGWDCATDRYHLRSRSMPPVSTKRELLSALSRSFDPLGICLPVITYARLLFQSACNSRTAAGSGLGPLAWDEPLPEYILAKWNVYASEITSLSQISIPRCFRPEDFPLDECIFDLLIYCDASYSAYSTVAFMRTTCGTEAHISFIMAKGTLVGKNKHTIPRLELKAAVLATQMAQIVKQELRLPISSIEYRTDSQVVLHQLQSSHVDRPFFVKSRLQKILLHSAKEEWLYVKSKDNVADDATRGLTPAQFKPDSRWINGPPLPLTYIRTTITSLKSPVNDPEYPPVIHVGQLNVSSPSLRCSRPEVSKLIGNCRSDLTQLKRSVALFLRGQESKEPLTDAELRKAFSICLITAAEESFPREIEALRKKNNIPRDSVLRNVSPYIDPVDDHLRVDGRLEHADLPQHTKHPIILAPDHQLTSLIIADAHHHAHHAGVEHTLAIVRIQFYLLQGRRAIRRTLARCDTCRFNNSRPTAPMMANLPKERLEAYIRPFTTTGIDLFGPFIVVIGRRAEKRWILIATCFSTRAIHLELVYSLSVDSCLMAIRRFIADRGHPRTVYSDNGTNLVAAEKELKEGIVNLNSELIMEEMVDRGIDWKFSPPTGSHFGGPYERLVASCKRSLVAVLAQRSVTDEVLLTVMKEVASLLNSRPITRVSTNPTEPEPLTPNHFIMGCHHPHVPPDLETEFDGLSRRRWKQAQYIINQFWRRWMREYVPELIERDKWQQRTRQMRLNDRVLILDENSRRGQWPIGTVVKLFPGDGGIIRRVAVQTEKSTLIRPVVKLCLISDP